MSAPGSVASSIAAAVAVAVLAACNPFGLPATRALENGVAGMLTSAKSFEIAGTYTSAGTAWTIDLQVTRPSSRHVVVSSATEKVEAIIVGPQAYFRGQEFLAKHLGSDALSQSLAMAAGNAWWKDSVSLVPALSDLTEGDLFRTAFLGSVVTQRTDDQNVGGADAVELSGTRADVFIATTAPYRLLRIHLKKGVTVDSIQDADLRYSNVDRDFGITAPADVIDFANLSTLPPVYTVVSVDASACGSRCVVAAKLKNIGGISGARAPSTVTFTMVDAVSKQTLGTCQATVQPDVGYNSTTTVSCTIAAQATNAAVVTASADNPGRG